RFNDLTMHLDNLLFILLIAMAALFRLLASKAGEAKKTLQNPDQRSTTSPQLGETPRRAPVEPDEERIRKILEALGQPATSRPSFAKFSDRREVCSLLILSEALELRRGLRSFRFPSPAWRNWQTL